MHSSEAILLGRVLETSLQNRRGLQELKSEVRKLDRRVTRMEPGRRAGGRAYSRRERWIVNGLQVAFPAGTFLWTIYKGGGWEKALMLMGQASQLFK